MTIRRIKLPSCLFDAYQTMFPTLDFSRIYFFDGIPWYVDTDQAGITLTSGVSDINIHLQPGRYDPCSLDSFGLIGHELVHALQAQQSFWDGQLNTWVFTYAWSAMCTFSGGQGNPLEDEAYAFEAAIRSCGLVPCQCPSTGLIPTPNFASDFAHRCSQVVKQRAQAGIGDAFGKTHPVWGILMSGVAALVGIVYDVIDAINRILCWLGINCPEEDKPFVPRGSIKDGANRRREDDLPPDPLGRYIDL